MCLSNPVFLLLLWLTALHVDRRISCERQALADEFFTQLERTLAKQNFVGEGLR
jgi:hypothetical protein